MAAPTTAQIKQYAVNNQLMPKEGPKVVPFTFDFSIQNAYAVDMQLQQSLQMISLIQSVYVRNPGSVAVTIVWDYSGQIIDFPPQSEGYLPVLVPNPPKFTVTSAGGSSSVQIQLLNIPLPANIWPIVPYILPIVGGVLQVADAIVDGAISSNRMQTLGSVRTENDLVVPHFRGGTALAGSVNGIATATLFSPGATQYFFISNIFIAVANNAAAAAAGTLTISIKEGGTTIFVIQHAIPAAAGAAAFGTTTLLNMQGLNYVSKTINTTLNITAFTALTQGFWYYNIVGGLTNFAG